MMANNPYKLENMLIRSYAHLRSLDLKTYFKATKDLHFDGLPKRYSIESMTRMHGHRYLMHAGNDATLDYESYCVDIDTLKAERLELNIEYIVNCSIDGEYMLVLKLIDPIAIFKDLQEIGQIEFDAKADRCKNTHFIRGRYEQHVGHSVYAVDRLARLYRIEWQDIKDGKYDKTLIKSNVRNF